MSLIPNKNRITEQEFLERKEDLGAVVPNTNFRLLLNDLVGERNWHLDYGMPILTQRDLVVMKGTVGVYFKSNDIPNITQKKNSKKVVNQENKEEEEVNSPLYDQSIFPSVYSFSVCAIANLKVPFDATIEVLENRLLKSAVKKLGIVVLESNNNESEDIIPQSVGYGKYTTTATTNTTTNKNQNTAKQEPKQNEDEEDQDSEDSEEEFTKCANNKTCGNVLKGFQTKAGKWIPAKLQEEMTRKSFKKPLCPSCNAKAYAAKNN